MVSIMVENAGTDRLRNRLEIDLVEAHAVGPEVVTVGPEAGRSALSLARRGYSVTALDDSQAMLDEVGSLARGAAHIDLRLGDIRCLPVGDETYQSLVSLQSLAHVSDWLEILPEWARVVRPGGRLLFDAACLDSSPITSADLVAEADRLALAVADVVPYGAFLGEGNCKVLAPIEGKNWWRRLLSWLATDGRLLDLALFLEQELLGRMPRVASGRCMVVLERRHDPQRNQAWLDTQDDLNALLAGETTLDALEPLLRMSTAEFKSRLNGQVRESLRNFRLFDGLLQALTVSGSRIDIASFLEADVMARCDDWYRCRELDRDTAAQARDWAAAPGVAESLRLRGVSLGDTLEYFLVEDLLTRYHGLFSGARS